MGKLQDTIGEVRWAISWILGGRDFLDAQLYKLVAEIAHSLSRKYEN